ncbi:hypothetical protein B566_EDAN000975 [Ephemera danica]|nr:hypothetical protein B566_EDAN000975 [Ephemera danica]
MLFYLSHFDFLVFMNLHETYSNVAQGKCGKVKEMYEQAVQESSGTKSSARAAEIRSDKARSIKERFEKGEVLVSDSEENDQQKSRQEDMSVFEAGISKKSRSLFLELDSAAKTQQQQSPQSHNTTPRSPLAKPEVRRPKEWLSREPSQEVVRAADKLEEVEIQTADISSRFKFFEGYREPEKKRKQFRITPPREGQVKDASPERPVYRDPDVVRAEDRVGEEELVRSQTASRPKPLKRFTPPPDYRKGDSGSSDEDSAESDEGESDEEESDEEGGQPQQPGLVRSADKLEDDFLKQALRAKFEQWDSSGQLNGRGRGDEEDEEDEEREGRDSLESTSSLRARFESMSQTTSQSVLTRERPKVNRFVVPAVADECRACSQRLYPMERLEAGGYLYHRKLESFTVNQGNLYCLPHFRQLFIARGNYEEGFGRAAPSPPHSAENPLESVQ